MAGLQEALGRILRGIWSHYVAFRISKRLTGRKHEYVHARAVLYFKRLCMRNHFQLIAIGSPLSLIETLKEEPKAFSTYCNWLAYRHVHARAVPVTVFQKVWYALQLDSPSPLIETLQRRAEITFNLLQSPIVTYCDWMPIDFWKRGNFHDQKFHFSLLRAFLSRTKARNSFVYNADTLKQRCILDTSYNASNSISMLKLA